MTTANRLYAKRVFDLTYAKREPAGLFMAFDNLLDEAGDILLDETGDPLLSETWLAGVDNLNEGMHYPKRVFDLTYEVRDQ